MTTLREVIRRLLKGGGAARDAVDFSYTVHWTRLVRCWPSDRRQRAIQAVRALTRDIAFEAQPYARRYHVDEVDEEHHDGASLLALLRVLEAFEASEREASSNSGSRVA